MVQTTVVGKLAFNKQGLRYLSYGLLALLVGIICGWVCYSILIYPWMTFTPYVESQCTYGSETDVFCTDLWESNCFVQVPVNIEESDNRTARYPSRDGTSLAKANVFSRNVETGRRSCWINNGDREAFVFFQNPLPSVYEYIVGILLGLASIAGVVLFIYFMAKSTKEAAHNFIQMNLNGYSSFQTVVDEHELEEKSIYREERKERLAFIRKTYLILAVQVAITFGVIAFFLMFRPARLFIQENWWIVLVGWLAAILLLIPLTCCKTKFPFNYIMLLFFTLGFSVSISFTCTFFGAAIVFQASLTTVIVFFALTLFTFQTKIDFSILSAGIFTLLICFISFIIIVIFIPFTSYFQLTYGLIGAILFSFFIIYDTSFLMEKLGPGDEILVSINLYLDLINMLIFLLYIFGGSNR